MNLKRSLGTVFLGLIAIGLLVAILAGFAVSPTTVSQAKDKEKTATPTNTATSTRTPTSTNTATSTRTPTSTHTPVPDCDGKIEIHRVSSDPASVTKEEPKICLFKLEAKDFAHNSSIAWTIKTSDGTFVTSGTINTDNKGDGESDTISLDNGDYKVVWQEANCDKKHKDFTIECPATATPTSTNTPTETPTNTPTETGTPDPTATATLVPEGNVVIIPDPNNGTITMIVSGFFECREVDWFVLSVPGDQVVVSGTISLNEFGAGTSGAVELGVGNFRVIWYACQQEDEEPVNFRAQARAPISQVSVLCNGCWDNVAYLWVGGTEQTPQALVVGTEHSDPAALWVLWNIVPWEVRVKVSLPAELDPLRWKFILWTGTGPTDYVWIDEATYTLNPFGFVQADFQLVDTAFWPQ